MTDGWDRKVLYTYINDFFVDDAVDNPYYKSVKERKMGWGVVHVSDERERREVEVFQRLLISLTSAK